MKIAGQKNDGAWFRANQFLGHLGVAGRAALAGELTIQPAVISMYEVATDIANKASYAELPDSLASVEAWVERMVNSGIPRQVWKGILTWDTYTRTADSPPKYVPDHTEAWRQGATEIRKVVTRFRLARRQMLDFANEVGADEGNPGGVADADITT